MNTQKNIPMFYNGMRFVKEYSNGALYERNGIREFFTYWDLGINTLQMQRKHTFVNSKLFRP